MGNKIRIPLNDALANIRGYPSKPLQDWMTVVSAGIPSYSPLNVQEFSGSNTDALQSAINKGVSQGGAAIILPPGIYEIDSVTKPVGDEPITLLGLGDATVLKRKSNLAAGSGMINVLGNNFTLDSLLIDGDVTVPTGLLYNSGFNGATVNDPMANSLTQNTSVWVHGPCQNFAARQVTWRHTGGYALLVDAGSGGIEDVRVVDCRFVNNRPHLFGIVAGQAIYGSWTGGILFRGDGRAANPGKVVKRMIVSGCQFLRNTGNCLWMHAYGLDELHEDVQFTNCYFLDCGLDGILVGAASGGAVTGNVFRRVGYVCTDDTSQSTPRWLTNLNATALDSSGLVKSVVYSSNSFLSVNGGFIDADGHGLSSFVSNVCRIPFTDELEYTEDRIAITGPNNNGSFSYGINVSNTSATAHGASDLTIVGNSLINLRAGAIRLFAARRCIVTGNSIMAPSDSVYPPIGMGPIGPATAQRCINNKIMHNKFNYSPAVAAPAIIEDDTYSAFLGTEKNTVAGNCPITPVGSLATEFLRSPSSGSVHYSEQVWAP